MHTIEMPLIASTALARRHRSGRPARVGRTFARRRGATAVEFAVVAPLFFLLLFVSIEFSRLNVIRHSADEAAYEAARTAMVPGATAAEARDAAQDLLNLVGARDTTIDVDPPVLDESTSEVVVTIDVPLDRNGYLLPRFTGGRSLRSQATLRTERVRGLGD